MLSLTIKSDVEKMRLIVNEKLAELEADTGLHFRLGNIKFGTGAATCKLECTEIKSDGTIVDKMAVDFERYSFRYGLQKNDLYRKFMCEGKIFTLVGAKPQNTKYPLIGRNSAGRDFKFNKRNVDGNFIGVGHHEPEKRVIRQQPLDGVHIEPLSNAFQKPMGQGW